MSQGNAWGGKMPRDMYRRFMYLDHALFFRNLALAAFSNSIPLLTNKKKLSLRMILRLSAEPRL